MINRLAAILALLTSAAFVTAQEKLSLDVTSLPRTKPLEIKGDIASELVAGVDKFLLKQIDKSVEGRAKFWKRDLSSPEAYNKSIEPNRKRLAHILGVRDARVPFEAPKLVATTAQPALVGKGDGSFEVFAVRWPAFGDVHAEGLLLVPTGRKKVADFVVVPDAAGTPEGQAGLIANEADTWGQHAARLAEAGCRVLVPVTIDYTYAARNGRAKMTNREYIYRAAFELGRHLIGYEVQKVLAAVDWFAREGGEKATIGVTGWGEGGMIALYAAALDTRISAVGVSGYLDNRNRAWHQPLDRNVFGLLEQFGDAEVLSLVYPRNAAICTHPGPTFDLPGGGGAPARLVSPTEEDARAELQRAARLVGTPEGKLPAGWSEDKDMAKLPERLVRDLTGEFKPVRATQIKHLVKNFDPKPRQTRQMQELDRHNQALLKESPHVRRAFMKKWVDLSQAGGGNPVPLELYQKTAEEYRTFFAEEVIGKFDLPLSAFNARSRKTYDTPKWVGHEVVLDVFPDVIAYGVLCLPKDLKPGEKRPVVVCQHGLEGRPQHVLFKDGEGAQYYKGFAGELAERGFITFAPQNLYIFTDRFRTLQRKANPIKKTLFSVIVPQHQQIVNWLKSLPYVDPARIGFYGLSYGGKSAMRIPPLVPDYALSICSADFNEWVKKNASTREHYSYIWTGEYEIFEFDLGSTFNYAEMAALIAPRPFMVERGHFDGVGEDEEVAYEFAKVRYIYQARLGLKDSARIEWFVGPHSINGKGTYDFLHKHLKWAKK